MPGWEEKFLRSIKLPKIGFSMTTSETAMELLKCGETPPFPMNCSIYFTKRRLLSKRFYPFVNMTLSINDTRLADDTASYIETYIAPKYGSRWARAWGKIGELCGEQAEKGFMLCTESLNFTDEVLEPAIASERIEDFASMVEDSLAHVMNSVRNMVLANIESDGSVGDCIEGMPEGKPYPITFVVVFEDHVISGGSITMKELLSMMNLRIRKDTESDAYFAYGCSSWMMDNIADISVSYSKETVTERFSLIGRNSAGETKFDDPINLQHEAYIPEKNADAINELLIDAYEADTGLIHANPYVFPYNFQHGLLFRQKAYGTAHIGKVLDSISGAIADEPTKANDNPCFVIAGSIDSEDDETFVLALRRNGFAIKEHEDNATRLFVAVRRIGVHL